MRTLTTIVLFGSSLVACMTRGGLDVDSAESAVDSSDSVGSESDLMTATVDGSETTGLVAATPEKIALRVAASVAGRWVGGCAKATASGSNVTITYTDCTGPRGLVHVS